MMLTAFFDLDGVLTDFVGGVAALFGVDPAGLHKAESKAGSIEGALGMSANRFWRVVDDAGERFWAELPVLEDGLAAWRMLAAMESVEPFVLSSPSQNPASAAGKMMWMQQHLGGPTFGSYALVRHKHLLARRGTLLVDDTAGQIEAFSAAGGMAVLMPRVGKSRRTAWSYVARIARAHAAMEGA